MTFSPPQARPTGWLAWLAVAAAALTFAAAIHGVRAPTFDDRAMLEALADPARYDQRVLIDYGIGRFYAPAKFFVLAAVIGIEDPLVLTIVRTSLVVLWAVSGGWLWGFVTGDRRVGRWLMVLLTATVQLAPAFQPYLSNPLLLLGGALLHGALAASLQWARTARAAWLAVALAAWAGALVCHEVFAVFLVVFWLLSPGGEPRRVRTWRRLIPFIAVTAAYGALALVVRRLVGPLLEETYAGAAVAPTVVGSFRAVVYLAGSGLPGYEVVASSLRDAEEGMGPLVRLARDLRLEPVVTALLAAAATYALLRELRCRPPVVRLRYPVFGALYAWVAPNVLPALTAKYQVWALNHFLPYYYSALGLPLAAGFLLLAILPRFRPTGAGEPPGSRGAVMTAIIVLVLVALVGSTNFVAADLLQHHDPDTYPF